jgi:uncharacterized protein YcbK (DUF882 family)
VIRTFDSAAEVPIGEWSWPHIDPAREWACRGTGKLLLDTEFLDLVEDLRTLCGWPLIITSGYRTPMYNASVSTTGLTGPHTTGRALDIRIYGHRAFLLIIHAMTLGFTGIGVSQKGAHASRFVHLDMVPDGPGAPRPWVWSY